MIWFDMIWNDMVCYAMIWCSIYDLKYMIYDMIYGKWYTYIYNDNNNNNNNNSIYIYLHIDMIYDTWYMIYGK